MFFKVTIFLAVISRTWSWTLNAKILCDENATSVDLSRGVHAENGIFFNGIKYERGEYYFDNKTQSMRGCICLKQSCMRKCCPSGSGYNAALKSCVPVTEEFDPPIWDSYAQLKNVHAYQIHYFLYGLIKCTEEDSYRLKLSTLDTKFHIQTDGQLKLETPNMPDKKTLRTPDKYCVDTFVFQDETGAMTTSLDALVCFQTDAEDEHNYLLSSVCMLISCVFFLITLGVYAWLPELQNLYGKVLMAYLVCLMTSFLLFAWMQIKMYIEDITQDFCLVMTFIIYFSLLSSFFWLNVMCFDIYWTFSGKRGLSLEKLSSRGRFFAYAVYAFGGPTLLTILLAALEFSGLPEDYYDLLPGIKTHGCFISGERKLLYLYGPILVLCVANITFFALTAFRIARINHQTSVLQSKESRTHDQQRKDKQRLAVYMKLFCVMGISWILEIVSALCPLQNVLWQIIDSYNVLIGVIIFIIFVCKRKIFRLIKKRFRHLRGEPMSRTQTTISSRTCSTRDDIALSRKSLRS